METTFGSVHCVKLVKINGKGMLYRAKVLIRRQNEIFHGMLQKFSQPKGIPNGKKIEIHK